MGNPRKVHVGFKTQDYYRSYKEHGGSVNRTLYSKILSDYFKMMREELFERRLIVLPQMFGKIKIVKYLPKLDFDEAGNLVNRLPVNLRATHELWESNKEAKEKRILVRYRNTHTNGYTFKVHWSKGRMRFLGLFSFKPNRLLKRELSQKIMNDNYDAFIK